MDDTFDWRINNRSGRYTDVNAKMYGSFFMKLGFALGRTPALFGMLAELTRGEYDGKATNAFWFKLPIATLQAMFFMIHKELKNTT